MAQGIKKLAGGLRKGLGIIVKCKPCGKSITYRALDFQGSSAPATPSRSGLAVPALRDLFGVDPLRAA